MSKPRTCAADTAVVRAVADGTVEEMRQTATSLDSLVRPIFKSRNYPVSKVSLHVRAHVLAVVQDVGILKMRMEARTKGQNSLSDAL